MGVLRAKVNGVWVDVGYDKNVLDARLAALDITSNRGGVVAVGSTVSNPVTVSAAGNPGTVLANLTFTPQLGRRYKVNFIMRAYQSNSASSTSGLIYLCDSGTPSSYFPGTNDLHTQYYTSLGYDNVDTSWLIDGDGVSHNFQVRMTRGVSDITAYPTAFYIEDVTASDGLQGPVTPVTQWNSALGMVAYSGITNAGSPISVAASGTLTLTPGLTFTPVAGRRYRFVMHIRAFGPGAGSTASFNVSLNRNGVQIMNQSDWSWTGGTWGHGRAEMVLDSSLIGTTSATFEFVISNQVAQPLSLWTGQTSYIGIEDIGPIVGVGPLTVQSPLQGWTALTLVNGYNAYGGSWQAPQYRIVGDEVQLRGLITGGSAYVPWVIPSNIRPLTDQLCMGWATKGANNGAVRINVFAAGNLEISSASTTGVTVYPYDYLSLNMVRWSLSS